MSQSAKLRYLKRRARGERVRPPKGEKAIAPVSAVAILRVVERLIGKIEAGERTYIVVAADYLGQSLADMEAEVWLVCEPNARRIRQARGK